MLIPPPPPPPPPPPSEVLIIMYYVHACTCMCSGVGLYTGMDNGVGLFNGVGLYDRVGLCNRVGLCEGVGLYNWVGSCTYIRKMEICYCAFLFCTGSHCRVSEVSLSGGSSEAAQHGHPRRDERATCRQQESPAPSRGAAACAVGGKVGGANKRQRGV